MAGPGTTVAEGGLDLGLADGGSHDSTLDARTLINQGTANWVGSGAIDLSDGSHVHQPVRRHLQRADERRTIDSSSDASGLFDNQGRFVVDSGGTMGSTFDNEGQVEISSGPWELSGAGGSTGTFTLDTGASLELNESYGIPYTVDKNGDFVSSPQINGGDASNVTLIDGSDSLPKPLGNNEEIPSRPYTSFFAVTGDDTVGSLDMTGGWLTITGTLTVTGPMTWTAGYIAARGRSSWRGAPVGDGQPLGDQQRPYGVTLINQSTITLTDGDAFAQQ